MNKPKEAPKKLKDYEITRPEQLALFELHDHKVHFLSNTIAFYDAIPKYVWGKSERQAGKFLDTIKREFEVDGIGYRVIISPASIESKDGKFKDHYPGQREEIIEDALRKITCEGKGMFLDDEAAAIFTFYQLRKELKRMGHSYNLNEIKESLQVCANTVMTIERVDDKGDEFSITSALFQTLAMHSRKQTDKSDEKIYGAFVRFNPLVTKSIKQKTFRIYHYEKSMSLRHVLARYMIKRLSRNYTQASESHPYQIRLTTIFRESGMQQTSISDMRRKFERALDELIQKEVVLKYKKEEYRAGRKITDWKFILYPHHSFVTFTKYANQKQGEVREKEDREEALRLLRATKYGMQTGDFSKLDKIS